MYGNAQSSPSQNNIAIKEFLCKNDVYLLQIACWECISVVL